MSLSPLARDREHILKQTQNLWQALRGANLFITGGTGFVGCWLLEALLAANDEHALGARAVLLTRDPARFRARAPHLANHPSITLHPGDATTFDFPEGAFDYVVHAATEPTFEPTPQHPLGVIERDLLATTRVLKLASERGTTRLLFTSSGAVYGIGAAGLANVPERYNGAPNVLQANAAYGESKRLSEFACASAARVHGFSVTIARLFAFVGAYLPLDAGYAIGNFLSDILENRPIAIAGDGTPRRSYLYGADLAIWLWTILLRGQSEHAYNVGSPDGVSIEELANTMVSTLSPQTKVTIARSAINGAAPSNYVPDTTAAQSLGLDVWIDLPESLLRTHAFHLFRRTTTTP